MEVGAIAERVYSIAPARNRLAFFGSEHMTTSKWLRSECALLTCTFGPTMTNALRDSCFAAGFGPVCANDRKHHPKMVVSTSACRRCFMRLRRRVLTIRLGRPEERQRAKQRTDSGRDNVGKRLL